MPPEAAFFYPLGEFFGLGKPVDRGTRIPVELVLRKLGEGAAVDDLRDAYPRLKADDIYACIAYAADTVAHEETLTTEPA